MKIPFADLIHKTRARLAPAPRPKNDAPLPSAKKSESEKLAKTILPNAVRTMAGEPAKTDPTSRSTSGTATIATEIAIAPAPRKISMNQPAVAPKPDLPPAVALALEPNIERAISLPLEDVIGQMPAGYLKPRESFDAKRRVLLKAAEVEKGMATGRPAISMATLYQQAPEIFMHTVPSSDGAMVALPFERVMTELSNLAVRKDQAAEQTVPQVETPFLQVTLEDTKRFGTPMPTAPRAGAAATGMEELRPVRIEPATAEAFAAAVPEAKETFQPVARTGETIAPETSDASEPALRIPFTPTDAPGLSEPAEKFGTGEPAFPRVPASSGPPVPTAAPPSPSRIPFSFPAPSDEVWKHAQAAEEESRRANVTKDLGLDAPRVVTRSAAEDGGSYNRGGSGGSYDSGRSQGVTGPEREPVLTLSLRPILQHLPPMQLGGNPGSVPADIQISFPMSVIAPQLASGKVAVRPNAFYAALPTEYRRLFLPDAVDAPVQLPLQDVLSNLPGEALRIRDDQEVHAPEEIFETPFSVKATEDAARFGGQKSEVGSPRTEESRKRTPPVAKTCAGQAKRPPERASTPPFDAKEAVARACALNGVASCSVIFADGLSLAGNIPDSIHVEGLCAVAPTLLQKLEKHMQETSLGPLMGMTVHGEKSPVSFFTAGNVCLTALHSGAELGEDSRRGLARITKELSRAYSQPETPRVDH